MYKTNPEYFNQNYNTSYNICKSKINIMVENRSNEIAEIKIKELITILLYSFTLVFIIIIFSIIIFNYIYKKQREIIFYEI
jgi:lipopolysaccharide/colanic/teichoic acid biosynthesis glycosyltransferase